MEFQNQLNIATRTAHEAGELLREGFYKEKNIQQKSSAVDWVTEYDQQSEKLIVDRLLSEYPDHGVLGEEGSRVSGSSGFNWIISYSRTFSFTNTDIIRFDREKQRL